MNRAILLASVAAILFGFFASHGLAQPKTVAAKDPVKKVLTKEEAEAFAALSTAYIGSMIFIGLVMCFGMALPILIAIYRSHPDTMAISIIAIFFSWTCIGWWIALIWAVKSVPKVSNVNVTINQGVPPVSPQDPFDFS